MRSLLKPTLIAAAAMTLNGFLAWNAQAASLTGALGVHAPPQSFSPLEKVACNGTSGPHCGPGLHWVCRPNVSCACVACTSGHFSVRKCASAGDSRDDGENSVTE